MNFEQRIYFERLFLTNKYEFFRFSKNYDDLAYMLLTHNFLLDEDINTYTVKIAIRQQLSDDEEQYLLSFVNGLLTFKPNIEYVSDFLSVKKDIEFDYPEDEGFVSLIKQVENVFDVDIDIKNISTFNEHIQK